MKPIDTYKLFLRPILTEFVGLVFIVFAICTVVATADAGKATLTDIGLVHLFAFAFMIYAFGGISGGHFNPAVTIQFVVFKKIDATLGFFYVVAQCAGSILGAYLSQSILPGPFLAKTLAGSQLATNALAKGVTVYQGFFAEFIVTALLVIVIWGTAVEKGDQNFFAGWSIAAVCASGVFLIGNITGSSLNPARSLGPEIVMGTFNSNSWIFWIAPITGAIFGAALYNSFFYFDKIKKFSEDLVEESHHDMA
jgi:MIP family channel proteins